MKTYQVKELMVPLSEYATISEDATIYEAVKALEKAQEEFDHTRYRHRAILVMDKNGKVVGKLSQLDILKSLEPKYREIRPDSHISKLGFSKKFILSMVENYQLFNTPMEDICRKSGEQHVRDSMHILTEGEYIDIAASLDKAIHLLVIGHHQSLLVTEGEKIVGILRQTDVFAAVFHAMEECFK